MSVGITMLIFTDLSDNLFVFDDTLSRVNGNIGRHALIRTELSAQHVGRIYWLTNPCVSVGLNPVAPLIVSDVEANFLQAGCPSSHPTHSIKALKD